MTFSFGVTELYFLQNQIKPVILIFWTKNKLKLVPILYGYCSLSTCKGKFIQENIFFVFHTRFDFCERY